MIPTEILKYRNENKEKDEKAINKRGKVSKKPDTNVLFQNEWSIDISPSEL
jgi:hypothetical protein